MEAAINGDGINQEQLAQPDARPQLHFTRWYGCFAHKSGSIDDIECDRAASRHQNVALPHLAMVA
jgi:hypothetical protein